MLNIDRDEFEQLVASALDEVPDGLLDKVDNLMVRVRDHPPEPGLLGLYEGVPLTERGAGYHGALPDQVTIYRRPLLDMCRDRAEIVTQVRITVIHEIAHHFGISDERLDELGWA